MPADNRNSLDKYLLFAKTEMKSRFDGAKIDGAQKAASASSATVAWVVIGIVAFFTYFSFVLWLPVFVADYYANTLYGNGNPLLVGYTSVLLFHLVLLLLLILFRKRLLQRRVYNKVFRAVMKLGE